MSPVHPSPASNIESPGISGGAAMEVDGSSDDETYVSAQKCLPHQFSHHHLFCSSLPPRDFWIHTLAAAFLPRRAWCGVVQCGGVVRRGVLPPNRDPRGYQDVVVVNLNLISCLSLTPGRYHA